uniref:Putative signal peptide peptidase n=1 Tax=Magnetococcus massalia (strain MO-1) TaxID=451514 RepID=A0A1S7LFX9_MAGMO|nr:putative signal peptide peptidase [Candidatus Magnetococcus massalia]
MPDSDWNEPTLELESSASKDSDPALVRVLQSLEESRGAERAMMERMAKQSLDEQRRTRRGRNLFRLFIVLYLVTITALWMSGDEWEEGSASLSKKPHTAVVDIQGAIMPNSEYDAETVIENLDDAFKDKNTKAVILRINSPGGSAVQSGMIYDEVQRLRKKYPKIPVYAALEDLCASGGYYIASSAQEIYANRATLVGSIGVIMQGFGLEKMAEHIGLEDRTLTAGDHKAFLSPFRPQDPAETAHAKKLLGSIHKQFSEAVRKGRGDRLKGDDEALFNGLVWTGEEAKGLGLVDGLGTVAWIAREKAKVEKVVTFSEPGTVMEQLLDQMAEGSTRAMANLRAKQLYMGF